MFWGLGPRRRIVCAGAVGCGSGISCRWRSRRTPHGVLLVVVGSLLALVGCGGSGKSARQSPTQTKSSGSTRAVSIVAAGDSDATGKGDPTGNGWVGRYAALIHRRSGLAVHVTNLATDGKTSDDLLR